MLSDLEKTATLLEGHLGSSLGLRLLGKAEAFQFFSYLFNLEEWAGRDQLRADTGVDRQVVNSPVAWHSDHVQIGKRHVQMFSLKTTPEASRPCLFSGLLTLDCDSVLCSTWRVKSTSAARSEIDAQEKFISFFKVGVVTRVMSGRDSASLDTRAGAEVANNNVDDLSEVIRSLDKKAQGEFSLRLLLAAKSPEQLRDVVPTVHRVFVDARAQVMEETLGNLSAFYAMFPGNHKFNVFPLWLAEDHHARLVGLIGLANISSLVSGKKRSAPQSALPMRPATANPQQVSSFETQQATEAKRDSEDQQRRLELAAEMQQLQAAQNVPGPEAAGTPPMTAAQRSAMYGDSPNAPTKTSNVSQVQAEAKQKALERRSCIRMRSTATPSPSISLIRRPLHPAELRCQLNQPPYWANVKR